MASTTDTPGPEAYKVEAEASEVPPPPPPPPRPPPKWYGSFPIDVALRVVLFAATLVALVVMVTAKQTKLVFVPGIPGRVPVEAKFSQSPAFVYFVAALSVACLYSILTTLASLSVILKPVYQTEFLLHFVFWDVLMLGIVAAATGAAGGVAYIGLKGNGHLGWQKVCPVYNKFCQHLGGSIAVALFASVVLVLLVMASACTLHSRIRQ